MSVIGIVLAGGRSSRFGGDKLAADLDGESILAATIAAVASAAETVIVAGPELPDRSRVDDANVALIRDDEPFAGPLAALGGVLRDADADPTDLTIVVGGDMPRLMPAVLRSMLDVLREDDAIDAVLLGRPETGSPADAGRPPRRPVLPLAVRVGAAARAAAFALASGDRSLQALVDRLVHVELPASTWLAIDPEARTLLDVDTPSDLDRLRAN